MNTFENIKNTWNKAGRKISADKSLNMEVINTAINADSISITSTLLKSIKTGSVILATDIILFGYNSYFYSENTAVLSIIILCFLLSGFMLANLNLQAKKLKQIDIEDLSLKEVLVKKINFFNKQFFWVLQSMAAATAFLPFAVNLTQESADGEFNFSRIFLLISFYIFVYFFSIILYRLTHSVYLKQLQNALSNLEKGGLDKMEAVLEKDKRLRKILFFCLLFISLAGILMFFIQYFK